MNILVINGSLTEGGNTAIMVQEFKTEMEKEKHIVNVFNLVKGSQALIELINTIDNVDMLAFASPIYWGGMTGILKEVIDYINPSLAFYKNLRYGTTLVNSEHREGADLSLKHFQLIFKYLGVKYIDSLLITGMQKNGDMHGKLVEVDNYVSDLIQKIQYGEIHI